MLDLIDECGEDLTACGYETTSLNKFSATVSKLFIDTNAKSKKLGFEKGHYFIINAPKLSFLMGEHRDFLKQEIFYRLQYLFKENKIKKTSKILIVGIGNPSIVADSFGVLVAQKILIEPFKKKNRLYKIVPNIFSNTGLNAYEIVHLIVEAFDISAVLLIDSLATQNFSRLGRSIQFNDAGLTPGSAMNNFGMALNRQTLHVPCICIGVPMLISSKMFFKGDEVILTEKDAEEKVEFLSSLIAETLEEILN